jgi:type 1 glutamine amidotransferase
MGTNRKAILLGDITEFKYHPLQAVEHEITGVFQGHLDMQSTEDREMLNAGSLLAFDLCISYVDRFRIPITSSQTAGLLTYVSGGGGLLIIHNGISLQARYEISQLIGAKFTGHPSYGPLDLYPAASEHEIMQGIGAFSMEEEPYRFDIDHFIETTILLKYSYEGEQWPAAWAHEYGLGRVVYLMPGHCVESFRHPAYRQMILQSGLWALRK